MTEPELERYGGPIVWSPGKAAMLEDPSGEYVRFDDVEAYTKAAIAAAMMGAELQGAQNFKLVLLHAFTGICTRLYLIGDIAGSSAIKNMIETLENFDARAACEAIPTPTDAMAALEAVKAQVRDEALEKAAQEVEAVTDWDYATQNGVAAAIRAMKDGAP